MKYCHGCMKFGWEISKFVSDNNFNNVNLSNAQMFYKEWKIISSLHLVSVTLVRGRFTISIEQDK